MIGNHQANIIEDKPAPRRKLMWLVIGVVIVLVAGLVVWAVANRQPQGDERAASEAIVNEAAQAIIDGDHDTLGQAAGKITRQPNYREIPEYTYLLARAYLIQEDSERSKEMIDLFAASDKNHKYVGLLEGQSHQQMLTYIKNEHDELVRVKNFTPIIEGSGAGGGGGER